MHVKSARVHWLKVAGGALVMFMGMAISTVAHASLVTFQFAGTICCASSSLSPPIVPNTSISGSYTFERTAPNLLGNSPLVGRYALSGFSLDVLGRHYDMNGSTGLRVIHVEPGVPIAGGTTDDLYRVLLLEGRFLLQRLPDLQSTAWDQKAFNSQSPNRICSRAMRSPLTHHPSATSFQLNGLLAWLFLEPVPLVESSPLSPWPPCRYPVRCCCSAQVCSDWRVLASVDTCGGR